MTSASRGRFQLVESAGTLQERSIRWCQTDVETVPFLAKLLPLHLIHAPNLVGFTLILPRLRVAVLPKAHATQLSF